MFLGLKAKAQTNKNYNTMRIRIIAVFFFVLDDFEIIIWANFSEDIDPLRSALFRIIISIKRFWLPPKLLISTDENI